MFISGYANTENVFYCLNSISNRFLENQPNEICSHLTEKASKGSFLKPENGSKITVTKEKERRIRKSEEIRKGGEEKKSNGCSFSFYNELLWI